MGIRAVSEVVPATDIPTGLQPVPADDLPESMTSSPPPSAKPAATPAPPQKPVNVAEGLGEAALNMGSSALALPVEAAASLYKLTTAPKGKKVEEANKATAAVGQAMTYQPRSDAGKAISQVLNYPAELISKVGNGLGDWVTQKTGSAGLGATAAMVPQAAAVLAGARGPKLAAKVATAQDAILAREAAASAPRQAAVLDARTKGFKLSPSEAGGPVTQTVQSVAGGPKLEKEISADNSRRVQELVKLDLELDPNDVLDQSKLEELREKAEIPYEQLGATGMIRADGKFVSDLANTGADFAKIDKAFPKEHRAGSQVDMSEIESLKGRYLQPQFTADEAILAMRQLRKDARTNLKNYDPEKNAVGIVQRQIADVFLDRLDRHAQSLGNPELVKSFVAARKQLAKIQAVEDAMHADRVSARSLARMYDNGKGRPLDGNLKTIAESATRFEKSFQDVDPQQWRGFLSGVDYFIGVAGAMHNPALSAAVLARPAARAVLKSKPVQRAMTKPKPKEVGGIRKTIKAVGNNPRAGIAGAAGTAGLESEPQLQ
jgi:hypothetical protein